MHIRQPERPARVVECQFLVVEAQLVQDRGVEVVHVDLALHGHVAEDVGFAVGEAGFESAAG